MKVPKAIVRIQEALAGVDGDQDKAVAFDQLDNKTIKDGFSALSYTLKGSSEMKEYESVRSDRIEARKWLLRFCEDPQSKSNKNRNVQCQPRKKREGWLVQKNTDFSLVKKKK